MSDFTAKFFLDIYEPEVLGAKDGVIHPDPQISDGIKNLVSGLQTLPPDAVIRYELLADRGRFLLASTGEVIGELMLPRA